MLSHVFLCFTFWCANFWARPHLFRPKLSPSQAVLARTRFEPSNIQLLSPSLVWTTLFFDPLSFGIFTEKLKLWNETRDLEFFRAALDMYLCTTVPSVSLHTEWSRGIAGPSRIIRKKIQGSLFVWKDIRHVMLDWKSRVPLLEYSEDGKRCGDHVLFSSIPRCSITLPKFKLVNDITEKSCTCMMQTWLI